MVIRIMGGMIVLIIVRWGRVLIVLWRIRNRRSFYRRASAIGAIDPLRHHHFPAVGTSFSYFISAMRTKSEFSLNNLGAGCTLHRNASLNFL